MERSTRLEDWPELARAVMRELDTWPLPANARFKSMEWLSGDDDVWVTIEVDPRGEYTIQFMYGVLAGDPTGRAVWVCGSGSGAVVDG